MTKSWRKLAEELADNARPILKRYYHQKLAIDDKEDTSPVTIADREAESVMRKIIATNVPDHGIIGEEFGKEREDATYVWVLDPIDGTKSFVTGRPLFGTLIALLRDGVPILGIIDMPILNERWVGEVGQPTFLNNNPVQTRPCKTLAETYLSAASPHMFSSQVTNLAFERLRQKCKLTTYNGDCYMYAMISTGFLDLVVEEGLGVYDYMALIPVIEGAGGVITDWQGHQLDRYSKGDVVAAGNRLIHDAALAVLAA